MYGSQNPGRDGPQPWGTPISYVRDKARKGNLASQRVRNRLWRVRVRGVLGWGVKVRACQGSATRCSHPGQTPRETSVQLAQNRPSPVHQPGIVHRGTPEHAMNQCPTVLCIVHLHSGSHQWPSDGQPVSELRPGEYLPEDPFDSPLASFFPRGFRAAGQAQGVCSPLHLMAHTSVSDQGQSRQPGGWCLTIVPEWPGLPPEVVRAGIE